MTIIKKLMDILSYKRIGTSLVSRKAVMNNQTVLHGYNMIYSNVQIQSSNIGVGTYICNN